MEIPLTPTPHTPSHPPRSRIEAPIIACNDNLPARFRPSTPQPGRPPSGNKALNNGNGNGSGTSTRKGREDKEAGRGSRMRSASVGRDHKAEMSSRYWAYLFENLERSISEIYDGCEKEENLQICKEVVLLLGNYTRDFQKLMEWFEIKWSYEKTPPPMRPQALAWEIRKPSLCLLPHTTAYEKLVALRKEPITDTDKPPLGLSLSSDLSVDVVAPCPPDPLINLDNPDLPLTKPEDDPLPSNLVVVDVGLQTDLEEDPDIYYFAGGRTVGFQTEGSDDYGPLPLITFDKTLPPVLVMSEDSSYEEDPDTECASNSNNNCNNNSNSNNAPPDNENEKEPSPLTTTAATGKSVNQSLIMSGSASSSMTSTMTMSGSIIMASSSDSSSAVETRSSSTQVSGFQAFHEATTGNEVTVPEIKAKKTFAEKAKSGIGPGTATAPVTTNNRTGSKVILKKTVSSISTSARNSAVATKRVTVTSIRGGGAGTTPRPAPAPAPRSNIASRCRTAVNTGQPLEVSQRRPSSSKASFPSATAAAGKRTPTPTPTPTPSHSSNKSFDFPSSNPLAISPDPDPGRKVGQSSKKKVTQVPPSTTTTTATTTNTTPATGVKVGITRSKSMVNPPSNNKTAVNVKEKLSGSKPKRPTTTSTYSTAAASNIKKDHSNSFVSLPDEGAANNRRGSHTVDADGWETVRVRRSKWSSSNSSIASTATNPPTTTTNTNTSTTNSNKALKGKEVSTKKDAAAAASKEEKEKVSEKPLEIVKAFEKDGGKGDSLEKNSADPEEEEIQRKEADLDEAIREEEMLEEELRQVEKDFERIENESTTETESEAAMSLSGSGPVSPEPDADTDDDKFFFVKIDDKGRKGEEDKDLSFLSGREPGRILSLREKLMSPLRRRRTCQNEEEGLKKYEAKLAKAERNREKLLQAKFNRYVELADKFETLTTKTKRLVRERAELISRAEERRERAAEKREEYIKGIRRKAHDEDSKAKEIAFINLLEAQNKRHEYFTTAQEIEDRLQTMQDERRTKLEERAGKASAVITRQADIKCKWQAKLNTLQEKRKKANERINREREERAKERSEMAQEKARDREERLSALNAQKKAEKEELEKKIKQKQEETARRHEENMEQIRQKAIELGAPKEISSTNGPSSFRVCTVCNIVISSGIHEMQHIRTRSHLEALRKMKKSSPAEVASSPSSEIGLEGFGLKFIADIPADKIDSEKIQQDKNRNKSVKKHAKKLMQKLISSGEDFEKTVKEGNSSKGTLSIGGDALQGKMRKNIFELDRLISQFTDRGSPPINAVIIMDRIMGEIRKYCVQNIQMKKDSVMRLNGLEVALKVLSCDSSELPLSSKIHAIEMIHAFILGSLENGLFILRGTGICTLLNLCAEKWLIQIPEDSKLVMCRPPPAESPSIDDLIQSIMALLFSILEYVPDPFKGLLGRGTYLTQGEVKGIKDRCQDIIGYIVASGMVDRISIYCSGIRGPLQGLQGVANLVQVFIDFIVVLVYTLQFCFGENAASCIMHKKGPDNTGLLAALESSEIAGLVSMSYSLLLYQGAPTRPRTAALENTAPITPTTPPPVEEITAEIVKSTLSLINAMARLDLHSLQNVLASDTVSLQFRHIASQLLWQVVPHRHTLLQRRLLNELIISIGNFTVGNHHNQSMIQAGQTPTVLQLLCTLPKEYFTDSKLKHNFLSTLLAATRGCQENVDILTKENIDQQMLEDYLNSDDGKKNVIVRRMLSLSSSSSSSIKETKNGQNKKDKMKKMKPLEESNSNSPISNGTATV